MTRVLVVEDEEPLAEAIARGLRREGMAVDTAYDGELGLEKALVTRYDVVVLDRDLPGRSGDDVCRHLARDGGLTRVLMLTAAGTLEDRVEGLELGADDYVTKPCGVAELLARIRAALRRAGGARPSGQAVVEHGEIRIDLERRVVTVAGRPVHLTPKEYDMLHFLVRNVGRLVTHRMLLRAVWGPEYEDARPYLHVFVGQLRRKLELDPSHPRYILTEPGVGYRLADA